MCKDCGCGEDNGVVTKVFTVPGMMCNNCKETVEGASLGLPGVLSAEVNLPEKTATVSFDPAKAPWRRSFPGDRGCSCCSPGT